jgi:hypothetical protein
MYVVLTVTGFSEARRLFQAGLQTLRTVSADGGQTFWQVTKSSKPGVGQPWRKPWSFTPVLKPQI